MRIYLISIGVKDWDCYDSHIIIANTKSEVRKFAIDKFADEGKEIWETANIEILGKYKGSNNKPFIALSSFNAG